jgi:AcrR family transcriptional regulator
MSRLKVTHAVPIWRKEDRTGHIYRVAAEIMCRRGFEATSMNEIADAVGLTKAGIYHYIRGKEDLLFEIMSFGMDMVDQDVMAPAQRIADPGERLRAIVERHARRIMEQGGAVTILLEEMQALSAAHRRVIRRRKRAYFEMLRSTLEELSRQGRLRGVDPTVAAFSLFGMLLWPARWYRREGKLTPEQAASELAEVALNGVMKARPSGSKLARAETVNRPGMGRATGLRARNRGPLRIGG